MNKDFPFFVCLMIVTILCALSAEAIAQNSPVYIRKNKESQKSVYVAPVTPKTGKDEVAAPLKAPQTPLIPSKNPPLAGSELQSAPVNAAQPLSDAYVESMFAPCTKEDMINYKKLHKQIEIMEYKHQIGLSEEEFQAKFKKALEIFDNQEFQDAYTVLSLRCNTDIKKNRP